MERIRDVNHISGESAIEWRIPEFLSLSDKVNARYASDSFSFAGESWLLIIDPNGEKKAILTSSGKEIDTEGYIDLFIWRYSSGSPINVQYSFELKIDDKVIHSKVFSECFEEKQAYGSLRLLRRDKFLKSKTTPSDALIVICKLKKLKNLPNPNKEVVRKSPKVLRENKVVLDMKELFLKKMFCDVVIQVKDQQFQAHRSILAARSPVFESTFRNEMKEKETGHVDIDDCDPLSFSDFLSFVYCGNAEIISVENVFSLFTTADKYDVQDLREKCVEFMKENLSVDTFCDTIILALQHSETELITLTKDFFAKNALKIAKTVKWQSYLADNPTTSNELFIKALEAAKDLKQ